MKLWTVWTVCTVTRSDVLKHVETEMVPGEPHSGNNSPDRSPSREAMAHILMKCFWIFLNVQISSDLKWLMGSGVLRDLAMAFLRSELHRTRSESMHVTSEPECWEVIFSESTVLVNSGGTRPDNSGNSGAAWITCIKAQLCKAKFLLPINATQFGSRVSRTTWKVFGVNSNRPGPPA